MIVGIIKFSIIFGVFRIADFVQSTKFAPKIINGNFVGIEKHPYLAAITKGKRSFCGGSIISDRWILTAAHCFRDYDPEKTIRYKVVVGGTKVSEGVMYDVVKVVVHPKYSSKDGFRFDITMVQVKDNIQFGPNVQKITIAHAEKPSEEFKNCVTAGWGRTDAEDKEHLQELEITTLAHDNCWPFNPYRSNICTRATKEGAAVCHGDSGGPLVCDGVQVGLLSYGSPSCYLMAPDVYTAVAAYYSWIRKTLRPILGPILDFFGR